MSIPPSGSPASPPNYGDLITGDSVDFQSSVGLWTNSGGTFTRDTTLKAFSTLAASLKLVTTTSGHLMSVPLSGTFKAGVTYEALLVIMMEEEPATHSFDLRFGNIASDYKSVQGSFGGQRAWTGGRWHAFVLRWTPTANRTSVVLRLARAGADVGTHTWHIGYARAVRLGTAGESRLTWFGTPRTSTLDVDDLYVASVNSFAFQLYTVNGASIRMGRSVAASNEFDNAGMGSVIASDGTSGLAYMFAEHAPGDVLDLGGFNLEVGDDYVGLNINELDTNTVQIYADTSSGYMMQLRNRGTNKGWANSDDGIVNARIASHFQWEFGVSGALSTGTNLGSHFQTPQKAIIDEVRIHVGTAPTGSTLIVDVNDDGTTVFTTQGNRPAIAISGTDDTSGAADGGTAVAKDSVITIDIDQVGSTIAGSDLTVFVRGRYIW